VGQAYRRLAFIHHPDRVAGMGPEAMEYSEERMKEINAAYSELRRRGA
jgi:DnaJ like chaperone protein